MPCDLLSSFDIDKKRQNFSPCLFLIMKGGEVFSYSLNPFNQFDHVVLGHKNFLIVIKLTPRHLASIFGIKNTFISSEHNFKKFYSTLTQEKIFNCQP